MKADFSERTFEFCFNAEFCNKYSSIIAGHPMLPTLQEEKSLGYDVKFNIAAGTIVNSIFLQHKVPSYAARRQHNNQSSYDAHKGPYYRFPVNNDQHNLLVNARMRFESFYYCAPLFNSTKVLQDKYNTRTILDSSILIDPNSYGITDKRQHHITYNPLGNEAFLHSEPKKIETLSNIKDILNLEKVKVDMQYIENLDLNLMESISELLAKNTKLNDLFKKLNRIQRIQYITGKIYGLSWILAEKS